VATAVMPVYAEFAEYILCMKQFLQAHISR